MTTQWYRHSYKRNGGGSHKVKENRFLEEGNI